VRKQQLAFPENKNERGEIAKNEPKRFVNFVFHPPLSLIPAIYSKFYTFSPLHDDAKHQKIVFSSR
jgi:hypothetical protein